MQGSRGTWNFGASTLRMGISDVHRSVALYSLLFPFRRALMDMRGRSQKERSTGGQSHCDRDRRSPEAEDEGAEGALPGVVWRGIALFKSCALISPDRLASPGESRRRSERTSAETD